MLPDLTNLLPSEYIAAFRRGYFVRLAVVGLLGLTALALSGALLLIPTEALVKREVASRQGELTAVAAGTSAADTGASARLLALTSEAARIKALNDASPVSTILRDVLGVAHPGVTLYNFAITTSAASPGVTVLGTASTRDALRQYQLALQAEPFIASANLPVSAYAQDTNINFKIVLTLTKP